MNVDDSVRTSIVNKGIDCMLVHSISIGLIAPSLSRTTLKGAISCSSAGKSVVPGIHCEQSQLNQGCNTAAICSIVQLYFTISCLTFSIRSSPFM